MNDHIYDWWIREAPNGDVVIDVNEMHRAIDLLRTTAKHCAANFREDGQDESAHRMQFVEAMLAEALKEIVEWGKDAGPMSCVVH